MNTTTETYNEDTPEGITLEYAVLNNVEEYVDVDIYLTLPTRDQYLVRVFKTVGEPGFSDPVYRYAATPQHDFGNEAEHAPIHVREAVESVFPKVHRLILEEEKSRKVLAA